MSIAATKRAPLARVQEELAQIAVDAQCLRNRLLHAGHKGLAQRVSAASLELASVVAVMGNASNHKFFATHFIGIGTGKVRHADSDSALGGAPEEEVHEL